jgi:hypothetical protein
MFSGCRPFCRIRGPVWVVAAKEAYLSRRWLVCGEQERFAAFAVVCRKFRPLGRDGATLAAKEASLLQKWSNPRQQDVFAANTVCLPQAGQLRGK